LPANVHWIDLGAMTFTPVVPLRVL
jgi:hypothetical protein